MAIGIVAYLTIQEGKNEEFETVFKELQDVVAKVEPGNNFYACHRSRESDTTYVVLEQYVDQDALDAHGKSDEFKAVAAKLGGCMGGAPKLEYLDAI